MKTWGYRVAADCAQTDEIQRFLDTWVDRTQPLYCSLHVPPDLVLDSPAGQILLRYVVPLCRRRQLALSLFQDPQQPSPAGRLLQTVEELLRNHPDLRYLVAVCGWEEQLRLTHLASTQANLLPLGSWGLMARPELGSSLARLRLETLGAGAVSMFSQSRVLEQLIGRWMPIKSLLVDVLSGLYESLEQVGYAVDPNQIEEDLRSLLGEGFWQFLGKSSQLVG